MKWVIFCLLVFLSFSLVVAAETEDINYENFGNPGGFENTEDLQVYGMKVTFSDSIGTLKADDSIESSSFKYKHGNEKEKRVFGFLRKDSTFIFEDKELIKAEFIVEKDATYCVGNRCFQGVGKYKVGDYEYIIPGGSKVLFSKGKDGNKDIIKITQPNRIMVENPVFIGNTESKKGKTDIKFYSYGNELELPNGQGIGTYEKKNENFILGFDGSVGEKGAFYINGPRRIGGLDVGVKEYGLNNNPSRTLLFLGEDIKNENIPQESDLKDPALLLDPENGLIKIFSPNDRESPSVNFLEGNKYVDVGDDGFFFVQALGRGTQYANGELKEYSDLRSLISIRRGEYGNIAFLRTEGSFNILSGSKLLRYNPYSNGVNGRTITGYNIDNAGLRKDVELTGKSSVPFRLTAKDSSNKDIVYHEFKIENGKYKLVNGEPVLNEIKVTYDYFMDDKGAVRAAFPNTEFAEAYAKEKFASANSDLQGKIYKLIFGGVDVSEYLSGDNVADAINSAINEREREKNEAVNDPSDYLKIDKKIVGYIGPSKRAGYVKFKDGVNNNEGINIDYISIGLLSRMDGEVAVRVTEPFSCGACIKEIKRKSVKGPYLTWDQAERIGVRSVLKGRRPGIPGTAIVKNGRIIKYTY